MNTFTGEKLTGNWSCRAMAILLMLMSFSPALFSQSFKDSQYNKRIISTNTGAVFSGDGDCWGFGSSISHLKTLGKRFYVRQSISSWIVNGDSWIEGAFENQTAIDLSAELGLSPFRMGQRFLSIHGGICGAYMVNNSPSSGGTWSSYNYTTGEYSYLRYYEQGFDQTLDYGVTFGLNYFRQISPSLYLNARADFRSHFVTGSAISMITIGIGVDSIKLFKQ